MCANQQLNNHKTNQQTNVTLNVNILSTVCSRTTHASATFRCTKHNAVCL